MATRLRKLQINEVSLCDAGANPGAFITLFKRAVPEIEMHRDSHSAFRANGAGPVHDALFTAFDDNRRGLGPAQGQRAFAEAWNDLTPDQKQQIRDEERAHTAAAAAAATAEQRAKEAEMNKSDNIALMLKLAHGVMRTGIANTVPRSSWHGALRKLAAERQEPSESIQQAVTRLVLTDPDAKALFKAAKTGTVDDVPPAPESARMLKKDSAYARLHDIGAGFIAADPRLTREQAFVKAFNENRELAELSKREQAFA
jgi:hypothetical protein